MAKPWKEVEQLEAYKRLPEPEKIQAKIEYFNSNVAPKIGDPLEIESARNEFFQLDAKAEQAGLRSRLPEDVEPKNQFVDVLAGAVKATPLGANLTQPEKYAEAFMSGVGPEMKRQMNLPEPDGNLLSQALSLRPEDLSRPFTDPVARKTFAKGVAADVAGMVTAPVNFAVPAVAGAIAKNPAVAATAAKAGNIPVGKTTVGKILQLPMSKIKDSIKGKLSPAAQDRYIRMAKYLKSVKKHLPESVKSQVVAPAQAQPKPFKLSTLPEEISSKDWYHGTGKSGLKADDLDPLYGNHESLFGQGIYLTDNPQIASGYAKARSKRTGTPSIYKSKLNIQNVLNLEERAPEPVRKAIMEVSNYEPAIADDLLNFIKSKPDATTEEIITAMRKYVSEYSHAEQIPTSEYVEMFQNLAIKLKQIGYDALTHTGGKRTGNTPHQALIVLDPKGSYSGKAHPNQIASFDPFNPDTPVPAAPSPQDLTSKMLAELKAAKPVRREQEALYTKERTERFGKAEGVSKQTRGQAGFENEKSMLKGELPKAEYEPITGKFSQDETDALLEMIKNSPKLEYIETVTGRNAILKMMQGKVPQESELVLLKKVFGNKLESVLDGKLPLQDRLWKYLIKTGNLSRGLMASFDMSMPLRQGIFLVSKPKQFVPAFKEMFRYFASEKALNQFQASLAQRPTFQLMKQAKLALTEMDGVLTKQEEQFMQANLAEAIPGIGKIVRASNRAAVGFLNKLRSDVFDDLIAKAQKEGIQVDDNSPFLQSLGDFINSATGRGNIKGMERALPVLNATLFSPRLLMSRINLLNPVYYMKQDPFVRKEALKTLAGTVGTLSTIMYMAKLGGAKVETDPTATDFGKIKIGNTRYDMGGGFLQLIRLYSQLIGGKVKSSSGRVHTLGDPKEFKPLTRLDVLARFAEYKTAPLLSLAVSIMRGTDAIGEEVNVKTLPKDIVKRYVPLVFQDLYDLYKDRGLEGLPMGIPAFFGVGTMTYETKQSNNTLNKFKAKMKARLRPRL